MFSYDAKRWVGLLGPHIGRWLFKAHWVQHYKCAKTSDLLSCGAGPLYVIIHGCKTNKSTVLQFTKFHTVICGSAMSSCHVGSWHLPAAVMWCLPQHKVVAVYNQHTKGFSTTWVSQRRPSLGKTTMFFQVFVCMAEFCSNGTMQHLAGLLCTIDAISVLQAELNKSHVIVSRSCKSDLLFSSLWNLQPTGQLLDLVSELGPMWNPGTKTVGTYDLCFSKRTLFAQCCHSNWILQWVSH